MSDLLDWVCLSLLPGLGPMGIRELVERFGSPSEVLRRPVRELEDVPSIRPRQLAGFASVQKCRDEAGGVLARMQTLAGSIVTLHDEAYPDVLKQLPDPPPLLYCLGDVSLMGGCCVAVVGSRSATSYGRRVAASFSQQLSANRVTVVSGMALGIDTEAHAGALQGDGSTIAVLGCGPDVVYPRQNRELFARIRDRGLVVSEYPPGTGPDGFRFPARNRIIAGMSRGVVVVEAARKSGSLITAQLGLDFGREVFGVPGQVDSCKSEGAHWLIRQGAQLVVSADDVLEAIEMAGVLVDSRSAGAGAETACTGLDPELRSLLDQLEPYPQLLDEVLARTGLSAARAGELLLLLELEGCIEMGPGNQVTKLISGS